MKNFIIFSLLLFLCNPNLLNAQKDSSIFYIDFIGVGDLQKSYAQGDDFTGNTGLGVLLDRFNHSNDVMVKVFELEARLNIASTSDSIIANISDGILQNRREFGSYILNPISRKQSLYLNANLLFNIGEDYKWSNFFKRVSGANFRVITSNNVWKYEDKTSHLGVLYFRTGIFHEFVPKLGRLASGDDYGRTKHSVFLGINYSWHTIFGDISDSDNSNELISILGTDETAYRGFELNFGFRINALRAEFQMPIIRKDSDSVEGLTNTQFLYSIRFLGSLSVITSSKSKSKQKQKEDIEKEKKGS